MFSSPLQWPEVKPLQCERLSPHMSSSRCQTGCFFPEVPEVFHFNYLGCDVSFEVCKEVEKKVNIYQTCFGTIEELQEQIVEKKIQMNFYNLWLYLYTMRKFIFSILRLI